MSVRVVCTPRKENVSEKCACDTECVYRTKAASTILSGTSMRGGPLWDAILKGIDPLRDAGEMVVDDGPGFQSKSSAATTCAAREKPSIVFNVIVLEQQVFLLRWHAEPRIISLISEAMSFA